MKPIFASLLLLAFAPAQDAADVVRSEDLRIGQDANRRYFLIGPQKKGAKAPKAGYKLLVVLPGGDGGDGFHPFIKRVWKHSLSEEYLVAQPVSVEWTPGQFDKTVWPTKKSPVDGMKFTTEEFVAEVIQEVAKRFKVDARHVFTLSWSSGGPPAYLLSLQEKRLVTGSFISMSVFYETNLPPLKNARGYAYYLHHSPEDKVCDIGLARKARDKLKENGAKVEFAEYEGGHGWKGEDVFGQIRTGFEWLEKSARR